MWIGTGPEGTAFELEADCDFETTGEGDGFWGMSPVNGGIYPEECAAGARCTLAGWLECGHNDSDDATVAPVLTWGGVVDGSCEQPDFTSVAVISGIEPADEE